ncbi:MAG: glycosyltransferase family 2 protein [Methylococcaceae bacterium]
MTESLPISVLIAVKDEEKNIRKCLSALKPVLEVIIVDSHSADDTANIAKEKFGATIVQFDYLGGYPKKRQWALNKFEFKGDWILLLDADEVVPDELWEEIKVAIFSPVPCTGYMITKGFHFLGSRFRFGRFSHRAVILLKYGKGHFEELVEDSKNALDMEVHERVIVDGKVGTLKTPLIHEDFKGLEAYIDRHNKYSTWEAMLRHSYLQSGQYGEATVKPKLFGNSQERRRFLKKIIVRMPFEPWLWFAYHYFFRLGLLEGRRGLIACQIRANYIAQVRAKMYELGFKSVGGEKRKR